jgi:nucleotide-binding universal stress UspA family protein
MVHRGQEIGKAIPGVMERAQEKATKWCSTYLAKTAIDLEAKGLKLNFECIEGVPVRETIAYADKNKMDLIAMATHSKAKRLC